MLTDLNRYYLLDETTAVEALIQAANLPPENIANIQEFAEKLIINVRKTRLAQSGLDAFLTQYHLASEEGVALMCLAEALLRIPDKATADKLIEDKIAHADWVEHAGKSGSLFVNAATWGLMLTGKIVSVDNTESLKNTLKKMISASGKPFIRKAIAHAMKILGKQFVMGQTIEEAVRRATKLEAKGYCFSYDMLGEAARTQADALYYFKAYEDAIQYIKNTSAGISIKLSALHPRYEFAQKETVVPILTEKLLALALQAKAANVGLTVDAEESERLDISLEIIAAVFKHPKLKNYHQLGLALQSYQKRAFYLIDELAELAKSEQKPLVIRLIKGAYWDTEIKNAQVRGLSGYPVFTRKIATDVSFLACAKKMIQYGELFKPAFATHNAYSLAAVVEMIKIQGNKTTFEFQCLHGMGYTLYNQIVGKENLNISCRVYAPVGGHESLLAYLVRRLLENGANTSFVNRIIDEKVPLSAMTADPVEKLKNTAIKPHPHIPLPAEIYGNTRKNAMSINLSSQTEIEKLLSKMKTPHYQKVEGPFDLEKVLHQAESAFSTWERESVDYRANCLSKAADLLEERLPQFISIVVDEGKKTIPDALAEVREAIDFCRYYAVLAKKQLGNAHNFEGPTGESNQLFLRGRGAIVCISPWNFPLAIFMGQITAALVTGNSVIAKPAGQTVNIAMAAVSLLHEAGIPKNILQLLPISGKMIGEKIISNPIVKGVVFTGSTEVAQKINQILANRGGEIVPFIAETGGQNCMIVDSSALTEQVVQDVVTSAFMSAGQRCSALRVLFLQEDIADKTITMLKGAMDELKVNDPHLISTDIGPVIDENAKKTLEDHAKHMMQTASFIGEVKLPSSLPKDSFFAPRAFEIKNIHELKREVFGPILHIIRYKASELDKVIDDINSTGYGLTMGIHSRIDQTVQYISTRIKAGNIYVNRNMIGAVVGVQPFGGEGLSGTGPKAGGPHSLIRLCTERTLTINTTAAGGNASLMSLSEPIS